MTADLPPLIRQRFASKLRRAANGCIEYTGPTSNYGYGRFSIDGKLYQAHRISWEIANGSIPDGALTQTICFSGTAEPTCSMPPRRDVCAI